MSQVNGYIKLIGVSDGTSLNGLLRVEGAPLVQRYDKNTSAYLPDFETMAEAERPTVYPLIRDVASGMVHVPLTVTWKYNGLVLSFGSNGLSTNSGLVGMFKRISNHEISVSGITYQVSALRLMKNLAVVGGLDNDTLTASGTVELAGVSIPFNDLTKEIVIQEATGNQYDVVIKNDHGSMLDDDVTSFEETALLYKDGKRVTDLTDYTFQWNAGTDGSTKDKRTVNTSHVNGALVLSCIVYSGTQELCRGYDTIIDASDPYYVLLKTTGITGNRIAHGETATVTPVAVKRSTGQEVPSLVSSWEWSVKDNGGDPFTNAVALKDGMTGASGSITYEEVMKNAKGGVYVAVSGTY